MKTTVLFAAALICAAVAGQVLWHAGRPAESPSVSARASRAEARPPAAAENAAATGMTLESLAGLIDAEVAERLRLEQDVAALSAEVAALRGDPGPDTIGAAQPAPDAEVAALSEDFRLGALVQAGIDEPDARDIRRRMDELELDAMNLQYEASQGGWMGSERFADAVQELRARRQSLRESIGDDTYDKYLYATGQPNRIAVQEVLEGSPAQRAGLRAGDVLLSYAGERLFTLNELMERSRSGGGDTVAIEILRNGRRTQIYMPRGPLGIRSGFDRINPADPSS